VAEALERLVEVYLALGLKDQARQTASVLGYNYPDSQWYRYAYANLRDNKLLSSEFKQPTKTSSKPRGFFSRAWHSVF